MRSKTSIQAMYINRVKDLNSIYKDFANLIDRKISGEDVEELYSEIYVTNDLLKAVQNIA